LVRASTGLSSVTYLAGDHTIGSWFRLFAHEVLPHTIERTLYMDTDVVILANLAELFRSVDKGPIFNMGRFGSSGFLILNLFKMPLLWEKAATIKNMKNLSVEHKWGTNDQLVFDAMNHSFPELVGFIPDEFDLDIAGGAWRFRKNILTVRPRVGMMVRER